MFGYRLRTHWFALPENAKDKKCLQAEEDNQEDKGHELVEGVQGVGLVLSGKGIIPIAGPTEASVKSNIPCSNEDDN